MIVLLSTLFTVLSALSVLIGLFGTHYFGRLRLPSTTDHNFVNATKMLAQMVRPPKHATTMRTGLLPHALVHKTQMLSQRGTARKPFVTLVAGMLLCSLVHVADVIFEIARHLGLVGASVAGVGGLGGVGAAMFAQIVEAAIKLAANFAGKTLFAVHARLVISKAVDCKTSENMLAKIIS